MPQSPFKNVFEHTPGEARGQSASPAIHPRPDLPERFF
nr:MAG TPA: hypothetical protein [Caudoviricetes sp.]